MERSFEARYREIERNLYLTAVGYLKNTEDARDMVQEAAITGYLSYSELKDAEKFKPWITRILINKCKDFLRREKVKRQCTDKIIDKGSVFEQLPETELEMMDLICKLPEKYRYYIVLRFYAGLTYKEISQTLRIPESTVKSRMKSALRILDEWMRR